MTVFVVYGDPGGPARAPALRLARALRGIGIEAYVRAAGRVARLGRPSALVLAVDRSGTDELMELIESFGLTRDTLQVYGFTVDGGPLPFGVRALSGTRPGGEVPRDAGAPLRLASRLMATLRMSSPQDAPRER